MFKEINEWEVMTPDGWSDFKGIMMDDKVGYIEMEMENNDVIKCSSKHVFFINGNPIESNDIKEGECVDGVGGKLKVKCKRYINNPIRFYDLVETKQHKYIINNSVVTKNCDEFAFVPETVAESFWVANYPTLSTGGNIVVVSTPNGTAGKFYQLWKDATSVGKKSTWKTMKIPWDAHPERDEAWKETQIQAIGKVKFQQEYNVSFTGSSYTLIDGETLESLKPVDPPFYPEEGFYMWKKPAPNRLYLVSCDVAKGANTDFHVANVWDATDWHAKGCYEQVAMFRRNDISVFDFKDKIIEICKKYNNAVAIVENNHLGHTVVHNMYFEDGYDNTWYDYDKGEYGVNASVKTKPLALSYFKEDVEKKHMIINSADMITELSYFEEVKTGVFQARQGRSFHDDIVASGYWAAYALRSKYWEDHVQFMLSKNIQVVPLNDEQQSDEEIMNGFVKAFGGSRNHDFDPEVDSFRSQLGRG